MKQFTWSIFSSYMRTDNDIVQTYYSKNDITFSTWDNVATTQKIIFNTSIDYHARLGGIYRPMLNLSMNKDFYETQNNARTNYFNYDVRLTNMFYLPKDFYIYFFVTYYPTSYSFASKTEDMWNLRLHIQKAFFDKKLTAAISFYNILDANPTTHSYGSDFTAKRFSNNNTQAIYVGLIISKIQHNFRHNIIQAKNNN